MNVLLFLPALGLLLLERMSVFSAIGNVLLIFLVQIAIGAPFLNTFPLEYFNRAFEFKRQFFYIWTVNWKYVMS
jgi:alpha-1,3-mannosyltransferase